MDTKSKESSLKLEKAVRFLVEYIPYDEGRKKLIIPHCLRVGFHLIEKGYSLDVVLGGLLHDIVEWTKISEELIKNEFGGHVFGIIMVNTQNKEVRDEVEKWQDMVNRCVGYGEDALVVKSADVIDSYEYYKQNNDSSEANRSINIGKYILEVLPKDFRSPIFEELGAVVK